MGDAWVQTAEKQQSCLSSFRSHVLRLCLNTMPFDHGHKGCGETSLKSNFMILLGIYTNLEPFAGSNIIRRFGNGRKLAVYQRITLVFAPRWVTMTTLAQYRIHNIECQHNTLCTMYTTQYTSAQCAGPDCTVIVQHVLCCSIVQHVLWCSPLCFLFCSSCAYWTKLNATCNMLSDALPPLLCNRSHGCLHPSEWRWWRAEALSAWETTTTTLPMSQSP